ncbi:putative quinol monooxygenase [Flavihumibacter solisilvae]|uniref:putative quinol monooxygenase n=1 Tax=Flavihumibacter solisilvae TaxID=1349421 RepID=UPI001364ABC1|nr:antibiotic biosynthesis monooxygenase [Flavihumibacter solisilvae]
MKKEYPDFGRILRFSVDQNAHAAFKPAVSNYLKNVRHAEGNIIAESYTDKQNSNNIWIIERWEDRNLAGQYAPGLPVSAAEIISLTDLSPLSKQAWQKDGLTGDAVTMMLFIHAMDGKAVSLKELFSTAMPVFRNSSGILLYQFSQLEGNQDRFVTFEKFRDEKAFREHLDFPVSGPIMQFLQASIQDPPFEKNFFELSKFAS